MPAAQAPPLIRQSEPTSMEACCAKIARIRNMGAIRITRSGLSGCHGQLARNSLIEGAAATTGAAGIRVPYFKTLTGEAVVKMNFTPVKVVEAGRIHKELDALVL